ncbi:hypothetical protein OA846_01635 [Paracoccaceae bacterium]|nr:hypothetical protein [Paracoccaceae bacterium]
MDKTNFFNLINAGNINSGLLSENFVQSHEDFFKFPINLKGLPILVAADPAVFEFSSEDVFEIPEDEILKKVYDLANKEYVGYQHAFHSNNFLSRFRVKKSFEKIEEKILLQNQRVFDEVARIKETYKIVGAFQTRNIPHFGHEKIIERMLELCDHVVINPVIGPKKSGDVKLEVLEMIYEYLISYKYEYRISFLPIFANMFYAGPNEAIHHAILRQKVGFDLFSVGRDHAGAQGAYLPSLAVEKLVENEKNLNIKIFAHHGAVFCDTCNSAVLFGECDHNVKNYKDIAGTQFRLSIRNKKIFPFADKEMQSYLKSSNLEIFEE